MRESVRWHGTKLRGLEPTSRISHRLVPSVRVHLPQLATDATLPTLPVPEDHLCGNANVGDSALHPEHLIWLRDTGLFHSRNLLGNTTKAGGHYGDWGYVSE